MHTIDEAFQITTHFSVVNVDYETAKQIIQRIKAFSREHTLSGLDWKTLRDEGRRY